MNYSKWFVTSLAALICLLVAQTAQAGVSQCGPFSPLPNNAYNGKLVFVGYPGASEELPTWADSFAQSLEDYFTWISKGQFQINMDVLRRLDQTTKVWPNPNPNTTYTNDCVGGAYYYGHANKWALQTIHDHYATTPGGNPDIWNGVGFVIIVHYRQVFPTQMAIANLGLPVPGFNPSSVGSNGVGVTMMMSNDYVDINDSRMVMYMEEVAAHELGHMIFSSIAHDPNSDSPGVGITCSNPAPTDMEFVNMGKYSSLDGWTPSGVEPMGYKPHHPMRLIARGWLQQTDVFPTTTTQTFDLADVRAASGRALKVLIPGIDDQYFLIVNHEGSGYDQKYGTNGILIWHIWKDKAWDLESKAGKNPTTGWDPLEANSCFQGSAADFFHAGDIFGPQTNPNSNAYGGPGTSYQLQPYGTGITISIRPGNGTNLLVDVSAAQGVYTPHAGQWCTSAPGMPAGLNVGFILPGQPSPVNIYLSDPSGTSYPPLPTWTVPSTWVSNLPLPPVPGGTSYKILLEDTQQGITLESNAFTIWDEYSTNMRLIDQTDQSRTFRVSWGTSLPTYGADIAMIQSPSGFYINSETSNGLTAHIVDVVVPGGDCSTNWEYSVSSTTPIPNGGFSTAASPSDPGTPVTVCACLAYMDFTLSGPEELDPSQVGTFTISGISGGSPPYTYAWQKGSTCAGPNWNNFGGNSTSANTRPLNNTSFCVKATVTDSQGMCQQKFLHVAVNEPEFEGSGSNLIFALRGVSPEPASGPTQISFELPEAAQVDLIVYDLAGREVARLPRELFTAGRHRVMFDVSKLTAGVYFYRLMAGEFSASSKMLVVNK
jgi:type IX secretion system substrate protein